MSALVNDAIWNYQRGQYWLIDKDLFNAQKISLQNKLGMFFLKYIRDYSLPHAEIENAHRFVSAILLHCGILQNCLQDFFEQVIMPMRNMGVVSENEAKAFLLEIRRHNSKKLEILNNIKELTIKLQSCQKINKMLTNLRELRKSYDECDKKLRGIKILKISSLPDILKVIKQHLKYAFAAAIHY